MKFWLAVIAALAACSCVVSASSRSQRAQGAAVFAASGCAHCHSIEGAGGHKGPDLSGVGRRLKKDRIRQQIVDGSKLMPAFGEDLQSAEIDDLIAYLHSCRDRQKRLQSAVQR